jgi:adenylylsulfate kinase
MSAGPIVWFTGLPSSGKSTLAVAVADAARARGQACVVLDGDAVRDALRPTPGYDDAARDAFYETLSRLAALIAGQGTTVLVPATANRRAFRERARGLAPGAFVEVYVDTDLALCRQRDAKGLYAKAAHAKTTDAQAGSAGTLPGVGASYEAPLSPELVVKPGDADAIERVLRAIEASR